MVYRVYVEKKKELANEAKALLEDLRSFLGIKNIQELRVINRYDVENAPKELFDYAIGTVFSEPQLDNAAASLEEPDKLSNVFAVEFLPGQFDQRADSAAQCLQIISQGEKPVVKSAKVYILYGAISAKDLNAIKQYVINPVEAREAELELPKTLSINYDIPAKVAVVEGFNEFDDDKLAGFIQDNGLAMDLDDIKFCRQYFSGEHRNPTITEIKMIDTYWSDHCRHTTFLTEIDKVHFEDEVLQKAYENYIEIRKELGRTKPVSMMDIGTLAAKYLKKEGLLDKLDESEEINACTVKMDVEVDGKIEKWLLLFKNETHNHPTEIEPFGGAATCVGGAIRDPLSGRAYVYGAMRLTGAADPTKPMSETIEGKLPQRKIVTTAAAGYSSYGNQIGLATGMVDEVYHPGYAAKRMEIGAVIAAAPAENVRREVPAPGDAVILLGGATGRDGIGGATGASKAHNVHSVENCGAEVQKGNAPEERKLQRLFRNGEATKLIKRCNDFGAGGVSVAIGELADGLDINLDMVPKKYEGLDGTELAISESQERMAVVVADEDVEKFMELAGTENLNAVVVAHVKEDKRLTMTWNGNTIVDISREFLNSNGAPKHIEVELGKADKDAALGSLLTDDKTEDISENHNFRDLYLKLAGNLNVCSKQGLSERFDSTIGTGSVLMPFGGKNQITPVQSMVHKIPVLNGNTKTCSLMSYGYNPYITEKSPYHGAYLAVVESACKLVASGAEFSDVYLTFQEYFKKLGADPKRWGQPMAALLGAFQAQIDLGIGAIGGKDSMSGSFEKLDVPPTLVSFAVTTENVDNIISPEFKKVDNTVVLVKPEYDEDGLPVAESLLAVFETVNEMISSGRAISCYTPGMGGVAEAVMKMCFGNGLGFAYRANFENTSKSNDLKKDSSKTDSGKEKLNELINSFFKYSYGSFILELSGDFRIKCIINRRSGKDRRTGARACNGRRSGGERRKNLSYEIVELGRITKEPSIVFGGEDISLDELYDKYSKKLEDVFKTGNAISFAKPVCGDGEENVCGGENEAVCGGACDTAEKCKSVNVLTNGAAPRVLIPVFPGTNCEYDAARAMEAAGAKAEMLVINNLSASGISQSLERFAKSLEQSQIVFIPGGFSGGDEPDGSGKFITAFFRNARIKDGVTELLEKRDGLMCGICNGFQALIKLGLVPYGRIMDTDENCPTLTFNTIGHHQSRIIRTRITSNKSPWLALTNEGDIYSMPISHGEGRFIAPEAEIKRLFENGQVATQYVDLSGNIAIPGSANDTLRFNPNGSMYAIEGITSPDGRVFGKMGHSERKGYGLYKNVPGDYDNRMFESAVKYFK